MCTFTYIIKRTQNFSHSQRNHCVAHSNLHEFSTLATKHFKELDLLDTSQWTMKQFHLRLQTFFRNKRSVQTPVPSSNSPNSNPSEPHMRSTSTSRTSRTCFHFFKRRVKKIEHWVIRTNAEQFDHILHLTFCFTHFSHTFLRGDFTWPQVTANLFFVSKQNNNCQILTQNNIKYILIKLWRCSRSQCQSEKQHHNRHR